MAAFTSAASGNWNDGATWGNTSPGVKGTDWPGNAADTATIQNTHVVVYNVEETNQLGNITVNAGGELKFSRSMDTLLTMGNNNLAVGGKLNVGEDGDEIPADYTAKILINTTSGSNGLSASSAGQVCLVGDPEYFGSEAVADLADDFTSGQTFTIVGDFTSKWKVGQLLILVKDGEYSNVATDTVVVTIASLSANGANTDVEISEAFPGGAYSEDSQVFNPSRNVVISMNGTEAITPNGADASSGKVDLSNYPTNRHQLEAVMIGWTYNFTLTTADLMDYVVTWNHYSTTLLTALTFNHLMLLYGNGAITFRMIDGEDITVLGSRGGAMTLSNVVVDTFRVINVTGQTLQDCVNVKLANFEIYKQNQSTTFFSFGGYVWQDSFMSGHFHENANGLSYWTDDLLFYEGAGYGDHITFKHFHAPYTDPVWYSFNYNSVSYGPHYVSIEAYNGDRSDPRMYGSHGTFKMSDADGSGVEPNQRDGGSDVVWKGTLLSNCVEYRPTLVPIGLRYYIASEDVPITKTIRIHVQTDYVGGINYFAKATCRDSADVSQGIIETREDQDDWDHYIELSLTVNGEGYMGIELYVWGYEASKYIWIDPIIAIS